VAGRYGWKTAPPRNNASRSCRRAQGERGSRRDVTKRGADPGQQGAVAERDDDRIQLGDRGQLQANGARPLRDCGLGAVLD